MQTNLKIFLKQDIDKPKIIVIYWPTGAWKTSMSINIAKEINSEIISTDSRQIFKYLNIWTGKITQQEKEWIKHHMIDIINPNEEYSLWEFNKKATKIINNLHKKWKIPILCWWTWLYIDSLIYDFDIPKVPKNEELRNTFEEEAKRFWNKYVYDELVKIDSEYAKTLHPNNLRYIIRALEVKILTWKSKKEFKKQKILKYDSFFITPYYKNREELYDKINRRVKEMFNEWLVDEVKDLLKKWYKKTDFWMKTIWYGEVISYLEWEIFLEECISLVQQHNRNYAKRQLTWFRNYEGIGKLKIYKGLKPSVDICRNQQTD